MRDVFGVSDRAVGVQIAGDILGCNLCLAHLDSYPSIRNIYSLAGIAVSAAFLDSGMGARPLFLLIPLLG